MRHAKYAKKKKSKLPIIILVVVVIFALAAIGNSIGSDGENKTDVPGSSSGITGFKFLPTFESGVELNVGESTNTYLTVDQEKEVSVDDMVFVSSDETVCTIEFDQTTGAFIYFNVTAVAPGSASVHVETKDGTVKSADVPVIVNGVMATGGAKAGVSEKLAENHKIQTVDTDELQRREIRVTIPVDLEAEASDADITEFLEWLADKQTNAFPNISKLYIFLYAEGDNIDDAYTIAGCEYVPGETPDIQVRSASEREAFRQ